MKGLIIYDTTHGNTKTIAETIQTTLKEAQIQTDLTHIKHAKLNPKTTDFLIIGSPTRMGTMSLAIKFFLGKIKAEEWQNKPFAAFDTENPENNKDEWSAAVKIAQKLKEKQMIQLVPVLKALVVGQKGPLIEGEIEKTKNYAKDLAAKLKQEKT